MHRNVFAIVASILAAGIVVVAVAQTTASAPAPQVVIKGISKLPITFDGHVSKFEYADAAHATFPNGHGTVDVYSKIFDDHLYFAFEIPDLSPFIGDDIVVMLDTKNDRTAAPEKDDIRAYVRRKIEDSRQDVGDGKKWADTYGDWDYRIALYPNGWEVEVRIPLKSAGLDADKPATMGLDFRIWDNEPKNTWNWPVGSKEDKPDTWGTLVYQPTK